MQSKIKSVDAQINRLATSREMEAYCGYCSWRMSTSNLLGHWKGAHKGRGQLPFATATPMATFYAHMKYSPAIGMVQQFSLAEMEREGFHPPKYGLTTDARLKHFEQARHNCSAIIRAIGQAGIEQMPVDSCAE